MKNFCFDIEEQSSNKFRANELGYKFEDYIFPILAGPDDTFCQEFDSLVEKYPGKVFNLYGKTSLTESAAFTKEANICVGNDTGLLHVAESLGTPILMIYGPTSEFFGFRPHLKSSRYMSVPLWCKPCSTTGKRKCFRKEAYCLTGITPEKVHQELNQMLAEVNG